MTAFAPLHSYSAPPRQSTVAGAGGVGRECQAQVIESSSEQPWAEFCKGLKEPAFLLPVTSLGDADHS